MRNNMKKDNTGILLLRKRLLEIEKEQKQGAKYYTLDELDCALKNIIVIK